MADEVTKPVQQAQTKAKARGFKLANGKMKVDVTTQYGAITVTNEALESDKFVAMLQAKAPKAFEAGLIVEK
jgi:hypothetical protein